MVQQTIIIIKNKVYQVSCFNTKIESQDAFEPARKEYCCQHFAAPFKNTETRKADIPLILL